MSIFLFTPPFTQLNTPYPATAYLKGFLNTEGIPCYHADIGIEVTLTLFSKNGLTTIFDQANPNKFKSENSKRIYALRQKYISIIDSIINFLQNKNPSLSHSICSGNFLPEASRFDHIQHLDEIFGSMGIIDKARHLSSLMLEDLSDFIVDEIDPFFGFSRYAERLGRSANSMDELYLELQKKPSLVDHFSFQIVDDYIKKNNPTLIGISIPFPGNLYSALRCGQFIKSNYPKLKIVLGGGFVNTELREIKDVRLFEMTDFICLDDGERPLIELYKYIKAEIPIELLKRTFTFNNGQIQYHNGSLLNDIPQEKVGTPDYNDLPLDHYLFILDVLNPMHRLWSDSRWNKLTMAHGCYWGKCTFCDLSLDYIKRYEANSATLLVDRVEQLIHSNHNTGFHFVDEAAPPALMKEFALEIIRRKINITWWANIRFEKSFTKDLCKLLAQSGCIAISGGLEVASDRLLALIDKGVTIAQVSKVCQHLTENNIMVHAYLMYGFPSQTEQETIDSLEVVRQMFQAGIIQSGFWHQFAMTAHSPVGKNPQHYGLIPKYKAISFANNDIEFEDTIGCDPNKFSFGLEKSLFNFMQGNCFELDLQEWFEHEIPESTVYENLIYSILIDDKKTNIKSHHKVVWLGHPFELNFIKKKSTSFYILTIYLPNETIQLYPPLKYAPWIEKILNECNIYLNKEKTYLQVREDFFKEFNSSLDNLEFMNEIRNIGLLYL